MKFKITNQQGTVLLSIEAEFFTAAIETAVKSRANLTDASLRDANLRGANLTGANLRGADLTGANLTGANLRGANLTGASLRDANLRGANLTGANLSRAYLRGAYLSLANLSRANLSRAYLMDAYLMDAYLRGANLGGADLTGANLTGANLGGANLTGAKGVDKNRVTPLRLLLEQQGPVRAYKLVNKDGEGPFNGGIVYTAQSATFIAPDFDANEEIECSAGINLATLDWAMREWRPGYRILVMEFFVNDPPGNLCIPTATDGKFRVKQCRRVGEKDLVELGLVVTEGAKPHANLK